MVHHMRTVHPEHEVFVSRLSNRMVRKAEDGIPAMRYTKGKSMQYVHALCLFCEQERHFMPHYWDDHIRSHTGEYGHECFMCIKRVCFSTHCGIPTQKVEVFNLYKENMYAFLCRKCNYIQLNEANIRKHLRTEHEIDDQNDYQDYYRQITLLPSMQNLPNSNGTPLHGKFINSTILQINVH